ncbi:MAG: universal stress protein [Acidimicrobiia bacterium]|nr:universal stress protein [Acidimicrobiia bacterium]MDX2467526.1 universal stress protein [Acidimicrobiia bacterium]
MSRIVCATNAGEDSRVVHMAAFRRAVTEESHLTFLHVLGGRDFAEQPDRMQRAITEEMSWLLHALVRVARERSNASDVVADVVLRTGEPRPEILAYLEETPPAALLIGVPRAGDASIFPGHTFDEFVAELQSFDVDVELVSTDADNTR